MLEISKFWGERKSRAPEHSNIEHPDGLVVQKK